MNNRREYEVLPRFVELSSRQRERARNIILSVKGREHAYWFKGTRAELEMKDSMIMSVRCLGVLQDGRVLVNSIQTSRAMICEAKALRYREKNDNVVVDTESTTMFSYRKLLHKAMQRDVKDWYFVHQVATDAASSLSISLYELSYSELFSSTNHIFKDLEEREMYGIMFTKLRDISQALETTLERLPSEEKFWFTNVPNDQILTSSDVIRRLRGLLFLHSKREIWNRAISKTQTFVGAGEDDYSTPPDLKTIVLNRKKASEAKTREQQIRDSLLGQLYSKMKGMKCSDLRCSWNSSHNPQPRCVVIKLHGEGVVDLGGPYRAVLVGIIEELKSGVLDLCVASTDDEDGVRVFLPNSDSDEYLYFLGQIVGIMIRCNIKFPLDVPTSFWKLLVGDEIDGDWIEDEDEDEEEEEEGKMMSCDGSREYDISFLRDKESSSLRRQHVRCFTLSFVSQRISLVSLICMTRKPPHSNYTGTSSRISQRASYCTCGNEYDRALERDENVYMV